MSENISIPNELDEWQQSLTTVMTVLMAVAGGAFAAMVVLPVWLPGLSPCKSQPTTLRATPSCSA